VRKIKILDEGFRVRVDNESDLWTLYQICSNGSYLGMLSNRRDSTTGTQEDGRAKSAERKPMWIVLKVLSGAFQSFSENLRIHGLISEATIDIGSHHTHIIIVGSELEITREGGMLNYDRDLLKESFLNSKKINSGLIVVENDDILVFEVTQHGMRNISSFSMRGGGKRYSDTTEIRNNFFVKVAKECMLIFNNQIPLIICGPGLARESFEKSLRNLGAKNECLNAPTSIGGRSAANEILAEGLADTLIGKNALIGQIRTIEEGLKRISMGGNVCFGIDEIYEASNLGAVEKLVIKASLLREGDIEDNGAWASIVDIISESKGIVIQSSEDHDAGQQLTSFGGAIALLRWKLT
tara:strand:+ start:179 stop:1237 length:1059 start_codon:yes stop_codon:yes gene_type:complete